MDDPFAISFERERTSEEREAALNDLAVTDEDLDAFICALPAERRDVALAFCRRPAVLGAWARKGTAAERAVVGFNQAAAPDTLRLLSTDKEPRVRVQLCFNATSPPDVIQLLSVDPDPLVQDGLRTARDMARELSRLR